MNGRPVTTEEQVTISNEYLGGSSIESLADKFHRSTQFVRKILRRRGVAIRRPGSGGQRKLGAEQQHAAVQEYRDGMTLEMLAEKYQCSPGTVRNVLSDHGVEMRDTGRMSKDAQNGCSDVDSIYRQRARARLRARKFGWTPEQFDIAWAAQQGRCAIHGGPMKNYGRYGDSVAVDHDHITGRPRALVCNLCNRGLGCFKDSPAFLRKAASYLEAHLGP
jgi:Mor family transcriptional regulator